jgi:hypothetical protein
MWTLLDYSAWSSIGPDDTPTLSEEELELPTNFWSDVDSAADDFYASFPHCDFELFRPGGCVSDNAIWQASQSDHFSHA